MSLRKRLRVWQEHGVIDAEIRARIETFEAAEARPYARYAVGGLAALSIVLGAISIVAANWGAIPRLAKMMLALTLVGSLAFGADAAHRRGKTWSREVLLVLLHGFILGGIALVGQTYHLGGKSWQALCLWALLGSPALILLGTTRVSAVAIIVAIDAAALMGLSEVIERADLSETMEGFVAVCTLGLLPLAHIAIGASAGLRQRRAAIATVSGAIGWTATVAGSTGLQHLWYIRQHSSDQHAGALMALPLILAAAILIARQVGRTATLGALAPATVLIYAVVAAALPGIIPHGQMGALAAISFLGFWALLAWAAYRQGWIWLFNIASILIAVRLLIVFVELFGSLMDTGLGLISGGIITLLLVWLWTRHTRRIRGQMRGRIGVPT